MAICKSGETRSQQINSLFALILLIGFCVSGLLYRESRQQETGDFSSRKTPYLSRENIKDYKRIALWTAINAERHDFTPYNQPKWLDGCPESRCLFTSRFKHQQADAIFFSMPDFPNMGDRPHEEGRKEHQYYVFYLEESPDTTKDLMPWLWWDALDNFFNLTMTYRHDSDIVSESYLGGYQPHMMNLTERDSDPLWFEGKRDILWLVSHCDTASKREEYVRRLSHYIKVDQYGRCDAPDPCRKHKKNCDLEKMLPKYKFYLSFENSFCNDYVTEKLIRPLNFDVVPIVMGAANYSSFLPESAVINIENFPSPKSLAKYLQTLMENQTLYERHLSWKYPGQPLWKIKDVHERKNHRFCKLCEILHKPPGERIQKVYPSVKDWWFNGQCREPLVEFKKPEHSRNDSYLTQPFNVASKNKARRGYSCVSGGFLPSHYRYICMVSEAGWHVDKHAIWQADRQSSIDRQTSRQIANYHP